MILLQWCYFVPVAFLTGFAAVTLVCVCRLCAGWTKRDGYRVRSGVSYMMAGLLVLNVYAEYFSLFRGVGLLANIPVILFCIGTGIVLRKPIAGFFMAGLLVLNVYAEYFSLFRGVGLLANIPVILFCIGTGIVLRKPIAGFFWEKLLVLNVYAEYFSLFRGVGLLANIPVILFCIGTGIVLRKPIAGFFWEKAAETGKGQWILYAFLTLLFAYGSSRGYMHYDTGLYHAQAIRWIEEYGVVPGLANLHSFLGKGGRNRKRAVDFICLSDAFIRVWIIAGIYAL